MTLLRASASGSAEEGAVERQGGLKRSDGAAVRISHNVFPPVVHPAGINLSRSGRGQVRSPKPLHSASEEPFTFERPQK